MIVSRDSNPNRQLYYLGACLLALIPADRHLSFFDAYQSLKAQEDISMSLFTLTTDWLYLLGAIQLKNGVLVKCS
jgi:hypothetical protein